MLGLLLKEGHASLFSGMAPDLTVEVDDLLQKQSFTVSTKVMMHLDEIHAFSNEVHTNGNTIHVKGTRVAASN